MVRYEIADAAVRAGVSVEELRRLVEAGILRPDDEARLTAGDVRRVGMVSSLTAAGIPLDGLGAAIRSGQVSLDFLDEPAYERFSALSGVTFAELAERTGVPVQMLMLIREAAGSAPPLPDDQVRDEELPYAEFLEFQVKVGFDPAASQGLLRVGGDSLRRMAETETDWWRSQVILPAVAAGKRPDEILGADFANRMSMLAERAILGMYHLQEAKAWSGTIIEGLEMQLAAAGLHSRLEHPPAMCFLDITGYTRLTQERGDTAAAGLADQLGRLVQRASIKHRGRPVKWLGDGVMFFFPDPGPAVVAALEMVMGVDEAGLPAAHVGLHAGPVIFQDGDYYGQTVNLASRIADYARPGEVLVSQEVVDASRGAEIAFREIGPVELKGIAGTVRLHAATTPG
ncbi:MAG TPA: adenylate/guanylate cyclase domain-containing protein [Candidatus Limnocylindrales bacterium]|jgi:adenylate cyclase